MNAQSTLLAQSEQRGFSLIELMVAIALFAVVMVVAVGSLLALVSANRKARALESVMNNLNITLDGMVRAIRMGTYYNCGDMDIPDLVTNNADCAIDGSTTFSFAPFGSDATEQGERWGYTFVPSNGEQGGQLFQSKEGGPNGLAITAPEVNIEEMRFYVIGTHLRDVVQPKVVIVVKGTAGNSEQTQTTFHIQSTAVQRSLGL